MTDTSKFEGQGLNFKAKLIGVEEVPEARGDQMCQDALLRLKNSVRASGEHKQKILVNVTLEGLKIIDAISMAVLHTHAVHRMSFISRDTTDNRAFGYVYGDEDNTHKFFAIKTASAAEQLVYTIRDLFQAVYNMKKKEVEEAKQKLEKGEVDTNGEGNSQTPGNGSTSGNGQTPQTTQNVDGENIYQVPPNNAPVKQPAQAEQVANLLDLEDQTEHILKGIEQIKNLDFDSIVEDKPTSPVSPSSNPLAQLAAQPAANPDPWGMPAASAPAAAPTSQSSALGDLAGLQTSPFPVMPGGMQPGFPMQGPFGAAPSFAPGAAGLPVTKDPFGNDPFAVNAQQRPSVPAAVGGFPATNPFGAAGFAPQQPFAGLPRGPMPGMMPGAPGASPFMVQPGMVPNHFGMGVAQMPGQVQTPGAQPGNLFGNTVTEDPNLLQPMKKDDGQKSEAESKPAPNAQRNDLFGDLVDIKKAPGSSTAANPKELFAQASASEKKSINALMAAGAGPGASNSTASQSSPFGDAFGAPQQPVNGNNNEQSLFG